MPGYATNGPTPSVAILDWRRAKDFHMLLRVAHAVPRRIIRPEQWQAAAGTLAEDAHLACGAWQRGVNRAGRPAREFPPLGAGKASCALGGQPRPCGVRADGLLHGEQGNVVSGRGGQRDSGTAPPAIMAAWFHIPRTAAT